MGKISEAEKGVLLPALEKRAAEILSELKDFQQETVRRIDQLYGNGQDRVLVADEVGLGKTMIAKGVLAKLAVRRCNEGDDLFKVTYICSNQTIARQNLSKLDIYKTGFDDITETRLSMQHLKVKQQELELSRSASADNPEGRKYVQLIPLTPATSFRTGGDMAGTVRERALMYVILCDMEGVEKECLEEMMKQYARSSWNWMKQHYQEEVDRCHREDNEVVKYPESIQMQIAKHETFKYLKRFLREEHSQKEQREIIGKIREMFAVISIDMLNPDLVIMDEFQRFQFMLENSQGEMGMLAERFLKSKSDKIEDKVRVLLLSATPYKLYSTLEEVGESAQNDSYKEFLSVMHFLRRDGTDDFDKTWNDYSRSLQSICNVRESIEYAAEQSKRAGDCMYELMCRTERLSVMREGDFVDDSSKERSVIVSEQDIRSYQEAMRVMEAIGMESLLPIDYVKSCPYLLSFMQKYELKERLTKYFKSHQDEVEVCQSDYLWLKERIGYNPIPVRNAKYDRLQNEVLPAGKRNELLLWMPPTVPYYESGGVFRKKENFSKMMVFSSWEMVPRMISCLLSHEVESRVAVEKALFSPRLKDEQETTRLLYTCFPVLADAFSPQLYLNQGLLSIKEVERMVSENIEEIPPQVIELMPKGSSADERMRVAVDIAIASPASCFYRITKDERLSSELAKLFINYLNTPEKTNIIQLATKSRRNKEAHWRDVLTYCKQGNLQAVLDEYEYFIMDGKPIDLGKFSEVLREALSLRTTTYTVETFARFRNKIRNEESKRADVKGMHSHYATAFAQGSGEKQQDRKQSLQRSFNSPFWPFVLASTSIGQEGLDFHPYCRKIMHWNLPSNPVDLEQREGRINRYKCLAIRQNIALKYLKQVRVKWSGKESIWNLLFAAAEAERMDGQSELIPYWCLGPNQQIKIERILANYPISIDQERYERLIKVLSLYRLTMGQARQSELLEYVFKEFDDPKILQDLYITLSPFEREKNSNVKIR